MRIFKSFATVAICAMVCAGFTACDDDDDDNNNGGGNGQPNPSKVFPLGTPSKIGSANVTTGANGLVSQIKDENTTVKFEYLTSRADNNYDVKMVITDVDYPTENDTFMMRLNNQGFVAKAPKKLVDEERAKLNKFIEMREKILLQLKSL